MSEIKEAKNCMSCDHSSPMHGELDSTIMCGRRGYGVLEAVTCVCDQWVHLHQSATLKYAELPKPNLSDDEKEQIKGRLDKIIRMVSETDLSRFDYLIYDGLQQSHSDLKELSQFLHERAKTRHDHAMKEAALVAYKKIKKFGFDEDERITINGTEYAVTDDKVTAFEAPPF